MFKKEVARQYTISEDVDFNNFLDDIKSLGYNVRKTKITALAYPRKEALNKLEALHLQVTDHVLKITVMPKSKDVPHWKSELKTWQRTLIRFNKSKTKSKTNYSEDILRAWLWEYPLGTEEDRKEALNGLKESGYDVPDMLTGKQLDTLIKSIGMFIAGICSGASC
jgi:hypothetical protein